MTGAVPVPAKGQPMKASWAAAVAERVNSLCAMAPAGMLARDGVGGMGAQPLPSNLRGRRGARLWSFHAFEDAGGNRTGGWYNCRLQVGYDEFPDDDDISGRDQCDDGTYYVEVDLSNSPATAEIKKASNDAVPPHDIANSKIRIKIGVVSDGALVDGPIDIAPVVYKYV